MSNLSESIDKIEDPRRGAGRRHPLGAVMKLLLCGLLSGQTSLNGIARWGRRQTRRNQEAMGFKHPSPCAATLSNILRAVEVSALQNTLEGWLCGLGVQGHHLALDGKSLRGTGHEKNAQLHLLSLFCTRSGLVVNDCAMRSGENEITAALRLLQESKVCGKVVTGDAIFAQKNCAD